MNPLACISNAGQERRHWIDNDGLQSIWVMCLEASFQSLRKTIMVTFVIKLNED